MSCSCEDWVPSGSDIGCSGHDFERFGMYEVVPAQQAFQAQMLFFTAYADPLKRVIQKAMGLLRSESSHMACTEMRKLHADSRMPFDRDTLATAAVAEVVIFELMVSGCSRNATKIASKGLQGAKRKLSTFQFDGARATGSLGVDLRLEGLASLLSEELLELQQGCGSRGGANSRQGQFMENLSRINAAIEQNLQLHQGDQDALITALAATFIEAYQMWLRAELGRESSVRAPEARILRSLPETVA